MLILQVHVIYSSLKKEVYNPQAVIPHAVLLRQAFAHCGKFPTAASRRSLDGVSVPVCLIVLSNQILIVALVSHYLTNKLISRKLLSRRKNPFHSKAYGVLAVVSNCYSFLEGRLSIHYSPVRHLADKYSKLYPVLVRLACVRHAASVHSEPGSNSP